jgi:putative transposase
MIRKGFKFRIYPDSEQEELLNKHFGATRFIYNYSLDLKIKTYQKDKKSISCFDIIKLLPKLKKKYEWLKEINSQSLQMSIRNLDNAFTKFFKL